MEIAKVCINSIGVLQVLIILQVTTVEMVKNRMDAW